MRLALETMFRPVESKLKVKNLIFTLTVVHFSLYFHRWLSLTFKSLGHFESKALP